MAADPEGISAFWSEAMRAYLGVALIMQGDLDEGLPLLDAALARYVEIRLHTNRATWVAARAQGLAAAGRVDEAEKSLAEAQHALVADGEHYATPIVQTAEAAVALARDDRAGAQAAILRASATAIANGGHGMHRRVEATALALGLEL
jgi:hypothetical protein